MILTTDKNFAKRKYSKLVHFVTGTTKADQLHEVLERFRIRPEADQFLSRCGKCNSEFVSEPLKGDDLPPSARASLAFEPASRPELTFWLCSNAACQKVFYQGASYNRAMSKLSEAVHAQGVGGGR